jgi:glutaredoxin
LPKQKTFLYAKIKCPYCKFFTTAPESLGLHMVDRHSKEVLRGYVKIKPRTQKRRVRK